MKSKKSNNEIGQNVSFTRFGKVPESSFGTLQKTKTQNRMGQIYSEQWD
jgi:hypothetical protein